MKFNEDFTKLGKMPIEIGTPLVLEDAGFTIRLRKANENEGELQASNHVISRFMENQEWNVTDDGLELREKGQPHPYRLVEYPVILLKTAPMAMELYSPPNVGQ